MLSFLLATMLLCILACWAVLQRTARSFTRPSPTTVVFVTLVFASGATWLYLLSPEAYIGLLDPRASSLLVPSDAEPIVMIFLTAALGLFVGAIGMRQIASVRRGADGVSWAVWFGQPISSDLSSLYFKKLLFWPLLFASVCGAALYVWYVGGLASVPLYMMLTGGSYEAITTQREQVFKFLPAPLAYGFHFLRVALFPLLTCFSYLILRTRGVTWPRLLTFIFVLIVTFGYNAASSALSPVLRVILQLMICELAVKQRSNRSVAKLGMIGFSCLAALNFALVLGTSGSGLSAIRVTWVFTYEVLLARGVDIVANAAAFLNVFGIDHTGPVGIAAIQKLAALFDESPRHVNNELFLALVPNAAIQSGTYNGPWFLYDYLVGGLLMVFAGALVVGVLLSLIERLFTRWPKTPLTTAAMSLTVVSGMSLFDSPLSSWLFSQGGMVAVGMVITVRVLSRPRGGVSQPPRSNHAPSFRGHVDPQL